MGLIKTEDLILSELEEIRREAVRTNELLTAINTNLVSIKANTRKAGGGIMGG